MKAVNLTPETLNLIQHLIESLSGKDDITIENLIHEWTRTGKVTRLEHRLLCQWHYAKALAPKMPTKETIDSERYRILMRYHAPAIADMLHCEEHHIGLELDDLPETIAAERTNSK